MQVKLISVDTSSCFFHRLTETLNKEVNEWLGENPNVELVSVTPSFHNVKDDDNNITIMTVSIVYN